MDIQKFVTDLNFERPTWFLKMSSALETHIREWGNFSCSVWGLKRNVSFHAYELDSMPIKKHQSILIGRRRTFANQIRRFIFNSLSSTIRHVLYGRLQSQCTYSDVTLSVVQHMQLYRNSGYHSPDNYRAVIVRLWQIDKILPHCLTDNPYRPFV